MRLLPSGNLDETIEEGLLCYSEGQWTQRFTFYFKTTHGKHLGSLKNLSRQHPCIFLFQGLTRKALNIITLLQDKRHCKWEFQFAQHLLLCTKHQVQNTGGLKEQGHSLRSWEFRTEDEI